MGMFSYVCTKCGPHDQFDWMSSCVVSFGKLGHVKGRYNGYGRVEVAVQGRCHLVTVCPPQFLWTVDRQEAQEGILVSDNPIYCHGNDADTSKDDMTTNMMQSMAKMQAKGLAALMKTYGGGGGGGGNGTIASDESSSEGDGGGRYCVPADVGVMDQLTQEQYEEAMKISNACFNRMEKKRREKAQAKKDGAAKKTKKDADAGNKKSVAPEKAIVTSGEDA